MPCSSLYLPAHPNYVYSSDSPQFHFSRPTKCVPTSHISHSRSRHYSTSGSNSLSPSQYSDTPDCSRSLPTSPSTPDNGYVHSPRRDCHAVVTSTPIPSFYIPSDSLKWDCSPVCDVRNAAISTATSGISYDSTNDTEDKEAIEPSYLAESISDIIEYPSSFAASPEPKDTTEPYFLDGPSTDENVSITSLKDPVLTPLYCTPSAVKSVSTQGSKPSTVIRRLSARLSARATAAAVGMRNAVVKKLRPKRLFADEDENEIEGPKKMRFD